MLQNLSKFSCVSSAKSDWARLQAMVSSKGIDFAPIFCKPSSEFCDTKLEYELMKRVVKEIFPGVFPPHRW